MVVRERYPPGETLSGLLDAEEKVSDAVGSALAMPALVIERAWPMRPDVRIRCEPAASSVFGAGRAQIVDLDRAKAWLRGPATPFTEPS